MTGDWVSGGMQQRLNLHDYERAAREALSPVIFDFVASGAGDQSTLVANREAFARWRLLPRVLRGVAEVDAGTTVLGQPVSLPVLLSPVGLQRLINDAGELASAVAAGEAGTIFSLSTTGTRSIEEIGETGVRWWFQLYVYRDRGLTRELVQRAEAAGASALLVTVDTTALGRREADERNRFAIPPEITLANFGRPGEGQMPGARGSGLAAYTNASFDPTISWRDIEWLAGLTALPVVPKGVLSPEDARIALEHGAGGIVVSNHGGRQLDGAVATLDALPAIVEAVAGRADILLDGGIRRGTDVLKAMALGARAVMTGRPFVWGLASSGQLGVTHVLEILRAELLNAMMLCGCGSTAEIERSLIVRPGPLA